MTLIRTSLLNGIAVIIKIVTMLGINKLLAMYVGPAGYVLLGQFQNTMTAIASLASGGMNTGVVKYTAEYYDDEPRQRAVWRTAGTISLVSSLFASTLIVLFRFALADWIFGDTKLSSIFLWFAASLVFLVFNGLLLAILNGKKEIARYVTANIIGSFFSFGIIGVLVIGYGLYGALIALAIYQSVSFFITAAFIYSTNWFRFSFLFGKLDKKTTKNLIKYVLMALTSSACVPLSLILIRNHLVANFGLQAAGYWEAMWRLSAAYLMLVTTTLSVYYLPQLSSLKIKEAIKKEMRSVYKLLMPIVMCCGLAIYSLRHIIVVVLFSSDFLPMQALFGWQVIGDSIKIGSWILSYPMLSKCLFKPFIISELFFSASFVLLTIILTKGYGLQGVTMAYAVNYFMYFIFAFVLLKFYRII